MAYTKMEDETWLRINMDIAQGAFVDPEIKFTCSMWYIMVNTYILIICLIVNVSLY